MLCQHGCDFMSIDVGVVQYEALVERTKSNEEILQQVKPQNFLVYIIHFSQ